MDAQAQRSGRRRFLWKRWLIIAIVVLVIIVGGLFWIIDSGVPWFTVLPVVLFTALGIVVALFQWLFPVSSDPHDHKAIHASAQAPSTSLASPTGLAPGPQPIFVHIPYPVSGDLPPVNKTVYRSIAGMPPLTDPRTIQQRQKAVEEVCAQLMRDDVTAVVLTGIGGVGKSTLAALIYRTLEEQRRAGKGPFGAQALWLKVDSSAVTMIDLVCTIFEGLGKPLPEVSNLAPHNQAATLFNALNDLRSDNDGEEGEGARLIVLDQFENLLDWQTGSALPDQPGIGEWLDIINGQPCRCRILLTSRPWPQGTRKYPPTYMQEYHVHGLEEAEGVELLRKLHIEGSDEELLDAVMRCGGHAYALTLLAALLRNRNLSLSTFFKVPIYAHVWTGNVARNLLDYIVVQQLDATQRKLLLAFTVFREPIPLEAAGVVADLDSTISTGQKQQALDTLLAQHLLQPSGEDRYQLHAIVARYALDHFDSESEQANQQALMIAHSRAAQYYRQYASQHTPPRGQRLNLDEVRPLVEAIWHHCRSGQWREAYQMLFLQGRVYADLHRWGHNVLLLDVFEDFMPLYKQQAASLHVALPYNLLGKVYRSLGRFVEAKASYEQALAIARSTGDRAEEGWAYNNLGRVCADEGKGQEAQLLYQQGLTLLRETKTLKGVGAVLDNLGWLSYDLGHMDQARAYYGEALELRKAMKDRRGVGSVLNSLGRVSANLGELEEARQLHEQALAISREVRDRNGEAWALHNLGRIYTQQGQEAQAKSYFEEALAIRRETGNRYNEGSTLSNLGHLLYEMGEKESALEYYRQALPLRREVGNRSGEGKTLQYLGQSYADLGKYEQAFVCFCNALRIRRALGHLRRELSTLNSLGLCALALQRTELALACFLLANDYASDPNRIRQDLHWAGKDQGPLTAAIRRNLELLQSALGEQAFANLLAQVAPSSAEIVERTVQATGDAS